MLYRFFFDFLTWRASSEWLSPTAATTTWSTRALTTPASPPSSWSGSPWTASAVSTRAAPAPPPAGTGQFRQTGRMCRGGGNSHGHQEQTSSRLYLTRAHTSAWGQTRKVQTKQTHRSKRSLSRGSVWKDKSRSRFRTSQPKKWSQIKHWKSGTPICDNFWLRAQILWKFVKYSSWN